LPFLAGGAANPQIPEILALTGDCWPKGLRCDNAANLIGRARFPLLIRARNLGPAATVAFELPHRRRFLLSELVFMPRRRPAIEGSAYSCFALRPIRSSAAERALPKRKIVHGGVWPTAAQ
jgi:hypothetical protein